MLESFRDPQSFLASLKALLEKREAEYALFLGYLEMLAQRKWDAFMALDRDAGGEVVAGALYRERNLILTEASSRFLYEVADAAQAAGIALPGVIGPSGTSEEFARIWSEKRGCKTVLAMDQKLYVLEKVTRPTGVAGHARLIRPGEVTDVARWVCAFYRESTPHEAIDLEAARAYIQERLDSIVVWESHGALVSMAGLARPTRHSITVNLVYTPPELRRRGFASAVVAAASAEGLGRGKDYCVLYTDLANPTSNSIYRKIGYAPIAGSRNYRFS